jgi:hypothetical protein
MSVFSDKLRIRYSLGIVCKYKSDLGNKSKPNFRIFKMRHSLIRTGGFIIKFNRKKTGRYNQQINQRLFG